MSLRAFADAVGVSYQTVANWENDQHVPAESFFLALALNHNDWRRKFALDALACLNPERYAPDVSDASDASNYSKGSTL